MRDERGAGGARPPTARLRIYPISGTGKGLFRPAVLGGNQAESFLEDLQLKSLIFGTPLAVADGLGYVPVGEAFR